MSRSSCQERDSVLGVKASEAAANKVQFIAKSEIINEAVEQSVYCSIID